MMEISDERFEELVDQALAQIPDEVHEHIKNVVLLGNTCNKSTIWVTSNW